MFPLLLGFPVNGLAFLFQVILDEVDTVTETYRFEISPMPNYDRKNFDFGEVCCVFLQFLSFIKFYWFFKISCFSFLCFLICSIFSSDSFINICVKG
jgi:hypothetical protein